MKTKTATDLFCGAGGTSQGYMNACARDGFKPDLLAINHWPVAIATHTLNHPGVRHVCEPIDAINPREAIPSKHLNLLTASPECTHHSIAAGGRPKNEQSRATAWQICRWVEGIHIDALLIENVKEFLNWGPLTRGGKPIARGKGKIFKAFIESLRSIGYRVEWRILNAADYGDATTRERLIILGRRDSKPIRWPDHSHSKVGGGGLKQWRPAREIIDWDMKGSSIFRRKRPLSPNTLRRIAAGFRKFGGCGGTDPFLVMLYGTNDARSVDRPAPTVTAGGNKIGVCEPFVMHVTHHGSDRVHPVGNPLPTVTGANRGEMALIEPFVLGQQSCSAPRSVNDPIPTIATAGAIGLVQPFIGKFYGSGTAVSVDEPLDTVTTKDRFGLAEGVLYAMQDALDRGQPGIPIEVDGKPAWLDFHFRMFQPHELSAAQGFPADYQFTGNRGQQVKQIGNAVPVHMSTELCSVSLSA